ncbi:MAG: histidine--tRNA ligase [Bdellovibrionales bacterium]|nr:histidine--tRNA ligase [Bdellovibrionales bacterium]
MEPKRGEDVAIQSIRGMHDLYGAEMGAWSAVEKVVHKTFQDFGYKEIRTPVLEKIEVFSQTVGEDTDIVQKQMYTIERSDEQLALRPEGTAAFVRAVIQHQLHRLPGAQRFYYYLPMYRYERPQKGRQRQFFQFGGELINDASPEADAEIITLLDQIYKALGLSHYEVRINTLGDSESRAAYRKALEEYFRPLLGELSEDSKARFERAPMRILDSKHEADQSAVQKAPRIGEYLTDFAKAHFESVKQRLNQAGVSFIVDPLIVRGLDYYSLTAFEFVSDQLGAQSALGGGGRYDGLAERFGEKPIPAVGFALGMERLMLALEASQKMPKVPAGPFLYLAPLGAAAFERFYPLSLELKRHGLECELLYEKDKNLKWQLKQANRCGAQYALLLGEEEVAKGVAVLKNMSDGGQKEIGLDRIVEQLKQVHST